ncbi:MAG: hypothetical protein ACI94Y_002560 [Maribacter sp.]|jgi:hypothetical protein
MKTNIINLGLFLMVILLSFLLISSIRGPIEFKTVLDTRKDAVTDKLEQHRTCQLAYKSITGEFASTYDTLSQVLLNDSFEIIKVIGDADAVGSGPIQTSSTFISAKDSLTSLLELEDISLGDFIKKLKEIPYSDGKEFEMRADTMTYQKILVPVISVGATYETFMNEFTSDKFRRYDSSFDPAAYIGYGSLVRPTTSGTWN